MITHLNIIVVLVTKGLIFVYSTNTEESFPTLESGLKNGQHLEVKNCSNLTIPLMGLLLYIPENARRVTTEDCQEQDQVFRESHLNTICEFSHEEAVIVKHFIAICGYLGYNPSTIEEVYDNAIINPFKSPATHDLSRPTDPGKLGSKDLKLYSSVVLIIMMMVVWMLLS